MRLQKLRTLMQEANLNGLLVIQPDNRRYLSGFTGSSGVLVITAEQQVIATDSRYYEQVRQQCPDWELAEVGYKFSEKMLELLRGLELGGYTVGFEADTLTVSGLHEWERALRGQLILAPVKGMVESLRMQKEEQELTALRKAIALADETVAHVTAWMKPGMTEKQVAWEIERYMRTNGATRLSFEPVVAAGPNGALPHARPSERVIQTGEPIVLDMGCVVDGYCSDITRTICLGQPADEQYLKVWHTVREAQEKAMAGAKADMQGDEIDKLARDHIYAAGYTIEHYGHGLGHGLGMQVHEGPRFSFTYPHKIPVNAVVTVEPGIYLPGWGGIRIEDVVLVTSNGVEILTAAPHEPTVAV